MLSPAPLIETPDAKAPPGGEASWFVGAGGAKMRAALFVPPGPRGRLRGSIVLSGGRTEPIEKYYEVIGELLGRGFAVLAHDWRGQGLAHRRLAEAGAGFADMGLDRFRVARRRLSRAARRIARRDRASGDTFGRRRHDCRQGGAGRCSEKSTAGTILNCPGRQS